MSTRKEEDSNWKNLKDDSPEGNRLQNGTDQVALRGGRFQAHEGGTGSGVVERSLGIKVVYTK